MARPNYEFKKYLREQKEKKKKEEKRQRKEARKNPAAVTEDNTGGDAEIQGAAEDKE